MDKKLTLKLDADVIERAKSYARDTDTSVSSLVERYLDLVAPRSESVSDNGLEVSPLVRKLTGIASPTRTPPEPGEDPRFDYLYEKHVK